MNNILIIGSRGMLGNDLVSVFREAGKVAAWDKEELDVTDAGSVREKIAALKPDVVINAVGYTDVDGAEANRNDAFALNDVAVQSLVEAAAIAKAVFVHFSTEMVFSGTNQFGYTESDYTQPVNAYGASKAAGEIHVQAYTRGYLIRTSWLFGKAPQRGKPRGKNFIEAIVDKAKDGGTVRVVHDQFGKPTATRDVGQAVSRLLLGGYKPGTYHMVNEGVATWYDFACEALRQQGIAAELEPVTSVAYAGRARRPVYGVLVNTLFPALRPWQQALTDYLHV